MVRSNPEITFRPISQIPPNFVKHFSHEANASAKTLELIAKSDLKIAVFADERMAGFVTANLRRGFVNHFSISGLFVKEEYNKFKLRRKLLSKIVAESRQRGYRMVSIPNMSKRVEAMVRLKISRMQAKPINSMSTIVKKTRNGVHGVITFKPRRRK